eukprot:11788146-Heterocapsa_arctica.AAC.1
MEARTRSVSLHPQRPAVCGSPGRHSPGQAKSIVGAPHLPCRTKTVPSGRRQAHRHVARAGQHHPSGSSR